MLILNQEKVCHVSPPNCDRKSPLIYCHLDIIILTSLSLNKVDVDVISTCCSCCVWKNTIHCILRNAMRSHCTFIKMRSVNASADFRVTILGNWQISWYCYLDIATKKLYFMNISAKTKIFSKILL